MFTLVFHLYNFLFAMRASHEKLSPRLTTALTSIWSKTKTLLHLIREHGSNDSGSSKLWNQESRDSVTTGITLRNPEVRLKPTLGKAISNSGRASTVTLKLLDTVTEELQVLRHLHLI
jgi:hypothetical protein